ncbi:MULTISPECIES: hypothetical protein [Flammeovirga]|uniref:Outer membrane protein beta-barrel domain-containing protein n=1 Tax=Flammeovirga agarivorans TaxID=2726742 RepID=A0A7X8SQ41_9BACT|nr:MULTISPECIES: hypothetical protein [Flammeovirga]NLR94270.1 hypothetical protein [Flammeovirga agarivorans]
MKKFFLLLSILFFFQLSYGQNHRTLNLIEKTNYTLIGGSVGGAYYSGGYANQGLSTIDITSLKPQINGYIQHKFARKWHFRFQGTFAMLGSKDNRNTSDTQGQKAFRTLLFEFSPMMVLDLGVDKKAKSKGAYRGKKSNHWNWYLMAGTGLFAADVNNYVGGTSSTKVGGTLNGGLGVRYAMKEKWILNMDMLFRMSTTNGLDGLSAQPLPVDLYATGTIGVAYRIPGRRFMR